MKHNSLEQPSPFRTVPTIATGGTVPSPELFESQKAQMKLTELAEMIYNAVCRGGMSIEQIEGNIQNWLVVNHYVQLEDDQPLEESKSLSPPF